MFGLIALHGLAAPRGDGLRPELLDLLARRRALVSGATNVADMAQHREPGFLQAGPNPVGQVDAANADNVVAFTPAAGAAPVRQARARSRR